MSRSHKDTIEAVMKKRTVLVELSESYEGNLADLTEIGDGDIPAVCVKLEEAAKLIVKIKADVGCDMIAQLMETFLDKAGTAVDAAFDDTGAVTDPTVLQPLSSMLAEADLALPGQMVDMSTKVAEAMRSSTANLVNNRPHTL